MYATTKQKYFDTSYHQQGWTTFVIKNKWRYSFYYKKPEFKQMTWLGQTIY